MCAEDGVAIFVLDEKFVFVQVCHAVGIAELAKNEEVVGEVWHDVSGVCLHG